MIQLTINPVDFARLMALPQTDRRDVLEFLGSTPLSAGEAATLVRRLAAQSSETTCATPKAN